jgi:hypothetical protein
LAVVDFADAVLTAAAKGKLDGGVAERRAKEWKYGVYELRQ